MGRVLRRQTPRRALGRRAVCTLTEAKVLAEDWRQDYNAYRPHRGLAMMTPTAFATGWQTAHEAAPASAELHGRYASVPFNAGGSPTLQQPTNHQLSQ